MEEQDGFVLVKGSGLVIEGPVVVHGLIFWPDSDADYVDVYDGLDAFSGKKFCRIESSTSITWAFVFSHGVRFDHGVYVEGIDSAVETTVLIHNID